MIEGRGMGLLAALAALTAVAAEGLAAQDAGPALGGVEVGIQAGVFVDYPSERAQPYCEQRSGGFMGHVTYWAAPFAGIEGAFVATGGYGRDRCPPGIGAPTPVGEPYDRNSYVDGDYGANLFSTSLAVVVEPLRTLPVSPRARLGLGRMLTHGRSHTFLGGGFRFRFGRHAMTMDVEWWNVEVRVLNETVIFKPETGERVLASEVFEQTESPFLIRVGWAMEVGG